MPLRYATLVLLLTISFLSCQKTETFSFTTPSTYRFNSPSLYDRQVFSIETNQTATLLVDSLGTFKKSNAEVADTLNVLIQQNYQDELITSMTLNDGKNLDLTFSKYDTLQHKFVTVREENLDYFLTGNDIQITKYPELNFGLDNDFMEIHLCKEFSERSIKDITTHEYIEENCTSSIPQKIVERILSESQGKKYDTIAVEVVNFIYSKY